MEVSTKISNSGHISEAIDIYYRPEAVHVEQPWMTHLPTIFVGDARNGVEKNTKSGSGFGWPQASGRNRATPPLQVEIMDF